MTITVNDVSKTYGQASPTFTASYNGPGNATPPPGIMGNLVFTTTATTSSHAGTYTVTASGATAGNYTINYVAGTLTIDKAALTITADPKTRTYGAANPGFTAQYAGFVNGDTVANLAAPVSLATSATPAS